MSQAICLPACAGLWYNRLMRIIQTSTADSSELSKYLDKPLLQDNREVEDAVRRILEDVREHGDSAVLSYVRRFDWPNADSLVVPEADIDSAYSQVTDSLLDAIKSAAENIRRFHERQIRTSWFDESQDGKLLGQIILPLERVGVLAPGFQAPLPSSVLMGAVPAKVAGVKEVVLCTPPRCDGSIHPAMAVAAREAGVDTIYRIGGAHGVAALAYGTESVRSVDKIVGPGSLYVTMAKRFVFGAVGIDMLAGPSEILILADESANPRFIAADLLSQAEHDEHARSILITTSSDLADAVRTEVERQIEDLTRSETARRSLSDNGAIIVVGSLREGIDLVNRAAPEHLELAVSDPRSLLDSIRNAGAIFLGEQTPEPIGDYIAGPNHTLPTSGTARFASPLNVDDFMKKSSVLMYSHDALVADAPAALELAQAEGLNAHANAIRVRLEGDREQASD